MKRRKFFAVRVVVTDLINGSQATRDYVRGDMHVGKQAFTAFALGDMIQLIGWTDITWSVFEIDHATVIENRKYHHTTH